MKQETANNTRWKMALWISWLFIIAIFAFGAAVDVDFVDPSVTLSEAWKSATLAHMMGVFHQEEYAMVLIVSIAAVLLYTFHPSSKARLGAMVAGFLTPVIAIGPVILVGMVVAPLMVLSILVKTPDGEFYEEGTLLFAACGLWMIPCLVLAVREALKLWRAMRQKQPHPVRS